MSALLLDYSSPPQMHLQEAQIIITVVISVAPYLTDKGEHTGFTRSTTTTTTTTKTHKNVKRKRQEESKKTELEKNCDIICRGEFLTLF